MVTQTEGSWERPTHTRVRAHTRTHRQTQHKGTLRKWETSSIHLPSRRYNVTCITMSYVAWCAHEKPEPASVRPTVPTARHFLISWRRTLPASSSFISVVKEACSFGTTLTDGVNYYSLQHYSWLDGVQGNLLSYRVCETRPVSRIMAEPIRQRQSHSIEIKPRWKSWSWETSPERLSDAGNYSSANTPADLQLLYHLIRALWRQKSACGRMWQNESSCLTWVCCWQQRLPLPVKGKPNLVSGFTLRASGGNMVLLGLLSLNRMDHIMREGSDS